MKTKLLILTLIVATALLAVAATDPVLMTINNKEIKLSEFEYLYHKNQQQQVERETLDQYADRFVTYKRKVADAEAAGLDTTAAFRKELEGYRSDIVSQYLVDTTVNESLVAQAYDRMKQYVDVDHFMYPTGKNYAESLRNRAFVDSLRTVLKAGEPWDSIALKYSSDPSVTRNAGHYGFITANSFPIEFEDVVYNTPVGEISQPFKTSYGYHMVRVNGKKDNLGAVHAAHILVMFPRRGAVTDSIRTAAKAKIDSIYAALQNGADFAEMAKQHSDDKGSAMRGGDLGWFQQARMVKEFDEMAVSMPVGAISEPFETRFGYHIIKKMETRPMATIDEARTAITNAIGRDSRAQAPTQARIEQKKVDYGFKADANAEKQLRALLTAHGGYDSTFVADVATGSNLSLYTFDKNQHVTLGAIALQLEKHMTLGTADAVDYIKSVAAPAADAAVNEYYVSNIYRDNKDYRNLLNEYRDGMLLFEISNNRVWEGASRDTVGLENYYNLHRDEFKWNEPHFKGIILKAENDSVLQAVKADIASYQGDSLTTMLHKKYTSQIRMERVPAMGRGDNKVVDYLYFGGTKKAATDKRYTEFMTLEGGLVEQPESLADVKGQVTSQYQEYLEKEWLKELEQKYPVTINRKLLKKVK